MPDHDPPCSGTKVCSKCGEEKHVLAFAVHRTTADGLESRCRDCQSELAARRTRRKKFRGEIKRATLGGPSVDIYGEK